MQLQYATVHDRRQLHAHVQYTWSSSNFYRDILHASMYKSTGTTIVTAHLVVVAEASCKQRSAGEFAKLVLSPQRG